MLLVSLVEIFVLYLMCVNNMMVIRCFSFIVVYFLKSVGRNLLIILLNMILLELFELKFYILWDIWMKRIYWVDLLWNMGFVLWLKKVEWIWCLLIYIVVICVLMVFMNRIICFLYMVCFESIFIVICYILVCERYWFLK